MIEGARVERRKRWYLPGNFRCLSVSSTHILLFISIQVIPMGTSLLG
jgi:hypothetical protein